MAPTDQSTQTRLHLRIFLASPGDVANERALALQVIDQVSYDPGLRGRVTIETVAWDKPGAGTPMLATMTPQAAIDAGLPKPSGCDIVVVVIWSRMGTPLPIDKYRKPDGSAYLSGTEWEYLDALEEAKCHGYPEVLVYRRTEKVLLDPDDREFEDKLHQRRNVNAFFAGFRNPDGSVRAGYNDYTTPETFREQLNHNLRAVIHRLLEKPRPATAHAPAPPPVEAPLAVPGPFSTSLPTIGRSEYEVLEKITLFGGRPIDLSIGFTAIEYAVATHSFDRDLVATLCETIRAPGTRMRSFTIRSLPGAGLSLALAQLVRDLFLGADINLFWVIDSPDDTCRVLSLLSKEVADSFYSCISTCSPRVEHAVIILDDVSKAPSHTIRNLIAFRERCKHLANERLGPRVTFIFGSFGAARTCSEDDTFELELTRNDRERCYEQMTSVGPRILLGVAGGLGAILRAYPEARWYENDAQAFIDFLLEHAQPTAEANKHWLARTDGLDSAGLAIFKTTAVAQLIGLHIEEAVVKRLFSSLARQPLQDVEQVVHQVRGLALIQQEWKGLGLSCARRARSILERTNTFSFDFLCETFSEFVREALDCFQADGRGAHQTLEFARHIFQRLSKEPLYRFNDDKRIAQYLSRIHLDALIAASDRWNGFEKARWAGTLSAVVSPVQGAEPMDDTSFYKAICLICGLCEDAFSEVSGHAKSLLPDAALSLYRASRLLHSLPTPHTSRIRKFCVGLQYGINTKEFFNILEQVLARDVNDPSYRANELVHARSKFEDSVQGKKDQKYCKLMYNWYAQVEQFFNDNHIELDAGNWLKRADYVWIDAHASARHREPSLAARANCLKQACDCVQHYPYSQGTWGKAVAKAVTRFLRENPAFASEFSYGAVRAIQL